MTRGVNGKHGLVVFEQNRRRMSEVLALLFVNHNLAMLFISQVNQGDFVTTGHGFLQPASRLGGRCQDERRLAIGSSSTCQVRERTSKNRRQGCVGNCRKNGEQP